MRDAGRAASTDVVRRPLPSLPRNCPTHPAVPPAQLPPPPPHPATHQCSPVEGRKSDTMPRKKPPSLGQLRSTTRPTKGSRSAPAARGARPGGAVRVRLRGAAAAALLAVLGVGRLAAPPPPPLLPAARLQGGPAASTTSVGVAPPLPGSPAAPSGWLLCPTDISPLPGAAGCNCSRWWESAMAAARADWCSCSEIASTLRRLASASSLACGAGGWGERRRGVESEGRWVTAEGKSAEGGARDEGRAGRMDVAGR
jgi:hypothetical protein